MVCGEESEIPEQRRALAKTFCPAAHQRGGKVRVQRRGPSQKLLSGLSSVRVLSQRIVTPFGDAMIIRTTNFHHVSQA
jgi:hypothetical protein